MQTIHSLINPKRLPLALTIGNFDGVHIGHQAIVQTLAKTALQQGFHPAVMTFSPHAKVFFGRAKNFLISSDSEKAASFCQQGIQTLYQIPFDAAFASMNADNFIEQLIDTLHVKYLLVGDDFRFGHQGQGDFSLLKQVCEQHGVVVQHTPTIRLGQQRVSSSRVRRAVQSADFDLVEQLLGRRLSYRGEVISGQRLGRQIDFPTANMCLPEVRLLPDGVFAVRVQVRDATYGGMCNIGTKPTVNNSQMRQIETHLFDFSGDLYGQQMIVEPVAKIREEQKFNGVTELVAQLRQDQEDALAVLASDCVL